ncbi:hypothetical protein [Erysipelothrix rhusiopathiae]|uniref:hypothetical protein n=1 Tax=Erysipelothrix rhusiopathiae TaxID=1648 RepID=UPI002480BD82|nr:hypothetical protein [Erysipelothrix rhusiopathiae]
MENRKKESDSEKIDFYKNKFDCMRKKLINASVEVLGENIFYEDIFFTASLTKTVDVLDGFKLMFETRNLFCEMSLLRVQMDIIIRLYAFFISEYRESFLVAIYSGEPKINKLKDKNGNKMFDGYLKEIISKDLDKNFSAVYDKCSGFIHYSDKSFTTSVRSKKDLKIEFRVAVPLNKRLQPADF